MKIVPLILFISYFCVLSAPDLSAQKLIWISRYYIEDETGKNQLISNKEARKLLYSFTESKDYYRAYQGLLVVSITTAIGSLPFLGHYAIDKALSEVSLGGSILGSGVGEDEVNTKPLFIGGGLLALGILSGISSYSNFTKAIDTYNEKAGYTKQEEHSLRFSFHPGSVAVVYSF